MSFAQRQIVAVKFRLPPDGDFLEHPCIVLSNSEINEEEEGFVAVMLTSQSHYKDDLYSFELDNSMLTKPLDKPFCAVRMHLIGNFLDDDVIPNSKGLNYIKEDAFNRLLMHINKVTFRFGKQS